MSFFGNWFEPLAGDRYGRTRFQEAWDRFARVEEYQLRQRYGLNEIKVVAPEPYVRGWNDRLDECLDTFLANWGIRS